MSKAYGAVTERLLKLKPGKSCVVGVPRVNMKAVRKHAPDGQWRSEAVEGGLLVTRLR